MNRRYGCWITAKWRAITPNNSYRAKRLSKALPKAAIECAAFGIRLIGLHDGMAVESFV